MTSGSTQWIITSYNIWKGKACHNLSSSLRTKVSQVVMPQKGHPVRKGLKVMSVSCVINFVFNLLECFRFIFNFCNLHASFRVKYAQFTVHRILGS